MIKLYKGTPLPFFIISIPHVKFPLVKALPFTVELFISVLIDGPQSALNPPILKLEIGRGSIVTVTVWGFVHPLAVNV